MSAVEQALWEFVWDASEAMHFLSDFDPEVDEYADFDGFQVQCEVCGGLAWISPQGTVFSTLSDECLG